LAGKLGVFWHTQGSGKSFSMIFYARKIFRKQTGNFTFVVVTDRRRSGRANLPKFPEHPHGHRGRSRAAQEQRGDA